MRACGGAGRVPHEGGAEFSPPGPVKVTFFGNGVFTITVDIQYHYMSFKSTAWRLDVYVICGVIPAGWPRSPRHRARLGRFCWPPPHAVLHVPVTSL